MLYWLGFLEIKAIDLLKALLNLALVVVFLAGLCAVGVLLCLLLTLFGAYLALRSSLKKVKRARMANLAKQNQINTIISRKGAGKSVLMQYLILTNPRSCVIFDPTESLQPFKNRIFFNYEIFGAIGFKKLLNHIGMRL